MRICVPVCASVSVNTLDHRHKYQEYADSHAHTCVHTCACVNDCLFEQMPPAKAEEKQALVNKMAAHELRCVSLDSVYYIIFIRNRQG